MLEIADVVALRASDVPHARAMLAEARQHAIAEHLLPMLQDAEGELSYESGQLQLAVDQLGQAIAGLDALAYMNPLLCITQAGFRVYLALALRPGEPGPGRCRIPARRPAPPGLGQQRAPGPLRAGRPLVSAAGSL